jgi:hypothetical protein
MTDPSSVTARAGSGSKRQGQRRVPRLPTVLASAACFLVVFEFLAFQLRSARDPALGGNEASAVALRPRPVVIHRRIIVRRVVESTPAASGAPASTGAGGSSAAASSSASAPASPPAAPAPAAPAAPAPAPPPVTATS